MDGLGFSKEARFSIQLAMEEAVTNAIKHGNKNDPTRRVHVGYSVCADRVVITVTDEGPGFDPSRVPDPTADDRLDVPTGRGIMLMRHYMASVEYSASGNQVKLTCLNA